MHAYCSVGVHVCLRLSDMFVHVQDMLTCNLSCMYMHVFLCLMRVIVEMQLEDYIISYC